MPMSMYPQETIKKPSHVFSSHSPKPNANAILANIIKSKNPIKTTELTIKLVRITAVFSAIYNFKPSILRLI